ncbi:hypothetical protein AVEN_270372-1 [Araneus ventricosus]|uniref:Uncharacterized protein n=1 Tax=Araneus ventricosus TaxID=182803 RepID=A0A4Y2MGI3_ARAVE|nr:hypothetical protein AVEN_270372-1 [Araneus ventricosus]
MHLTYEATDCNGRTALVYSRKFSLEVHSPQSLRRSMWFQHDGAPPPYTNDVHKHLNNTFGKHWMCRGSPVQYPARSPGLSCLGFF